MRIIVPVQVKESDSAKRVSFYSFKTKSFGSAMKDISVEGSKTKTFIETHAWDARDGKTVLSRVLKVLANGDEWLLPLFAALESRTVYIFYVCGRSASGLARFPLLFLSARWKTKGVCGGGKLKNV